MAVEVAATSRIGAVSPMQNTRSLIVAAVISIAIGLVLTAVLALDKARLVLDDLQKARASLLVTMARDSLAAATSSGTPLSDLRAGQEIVERVAGHDKELIGLAVFDDAWRPLYQTGTPASRPGPKDFGIQGERKPTEPLVLVRDGRFQLYMPIAAPNGGTAGWIEARYATTANESRLGEIRTVLSILIALLVGVTVVVSYAVLVRDATGSRDGAVPGAKASPVSSRLRIVLMVATPVNMAILLAANFILCDRNFLAAAESKAKVLAALVGDELSRTYDLRVPLAELAGRRTVARDDDPGKPGNRRYPGCRVGRGAGNRSRRAR